MKPTRIKSILRLEMSYKKMPIDHAIRLLTMEQHNGATHARVTIRWEEQEEQTQKSKR